MVRKKGGDSPRKRVTQTRKEKLTIREKRMEHLVELAGYKDKQRIVHIKGERQRLTPKTNPITPYRGFLFREMTSLQRPRLKGARMQEFVDNWEKGIEWNRPGYKQVMRAPRRMAWSNYRYTPLIKRGYIAKGSNIDRLNKKAAVSKEYFVGRFGHHKSKFIHPEKGELQFTATEPTVYDVLMGSAGHYNHNEHSAKFFTHHPIGEHIATMAHEAKHARQALKHGETYFAEEVKKIGDTMAEDYNKRYKAMRHEVTAERYGQLAKKVFINDYHKWMSLPRRRL